MEEAGENAEEEEFCLTKTVDGKKLENWNSILKYVLSLDLFNFHCSLLLELHLLIDISDSKTDPDVLMLP